LPELRKKYGWFYLNNYDGIESTEFCLWWVLKKALCIFHWLLNEGDEVLIPIRVSNIYVSNELSRGCACIMI
jgi:hypothetical protein